ncbi:MAG: hypothetical protein ACK40G_17190 [Cytophagaceae bacterium]
MLKEKHIKNGSFTVILFLSIVIQSFGQSKIEIINDSVTFNSIWNNYYKINLLNPTIINPSLEFYYWRPNSNLTVYQTSYQKIDSSIVLASKQNEKIKILPNPFYNNIENILRYFEVLKVDVGSYLVIRSMSNERPTGDKIVTLKIGFKDGNYFYIMCYGNLNWQSNTFADYPGLKDNLLYLLLNTVL